MVVTTSDRWGRRDDQTDDSARSCSCIAYRRHYGVAADKDVQRSQEPYEMDNRGIPESYDRERYS